jgi:membrane protein implicated in regulation of membrane protease activity
VALVVALLLAFFVLDEPWDVVVVVGALVLEVGEIVFWFWYSKRRRVQVGAETLIGRPGVVITECRPHGQVRVDGEIWAARCASSADVGTAVRVEGLEGLTLLVVSDHLTGSGASRESARADPRPLGT